MLRQAKRWAPLAGLGAALAAFALWRALAVPTTLDPATFAARYAVPLSAPQSGLIVHHLGHSLVGRDMPAMVAELARAAGVASHAQTSQLGWGTSLDQHWRGDVPGFEQENAHPAHRPTLAALADRPDALIVTEMVELRDAIRWHRSGAALADWARLARAANPDIRLYLYETWHRLDDPEGWLTRVDADLSRYWEGVLLRQAMAIPATGTIHVIPAGQALARAVRAAEAGDLPGIPDRTSFFARTPEGAQDPIHLSDFGAYVVALTHFATLYHRSPEGLPHRLSRADGTAADPPPDAAVPALQRLVWDVVRGYALSGVALR